MSNTASPYPPNQQFQQQAYQQNYQNPGFNTNQGFNPNQAYNQGQGFNYNVNYPSAPAKKNKTPLIILAIVLIAAALGAAAYFLFIKDSGSTKNKETPAFELTNKLPSNSSSLSKSQEKQASDKLLSILSSANSNRNIDVEPESIEKYGSLAPLVRITQEYYSKLQDAKNSMQKELDNLDIESVFTEKVIGNSDSIQSMRDKLITYSGKYKEYEKTIRNSLTEFKNKLKSLNIPSSIRSDMVDGFEKTSEQTVLMMEEFFQAEENFLTKLDELLTFLQNRQGEYEVTEEQVNFYSDEDVDKYNEIYNSIQEYAQKEVDIQKKINDRSQNSINNFKDSLN